MCLEYPRHFIARHKTVGCPSKTAEDGVFSTFLFGGFESLESRTIKRGSALERFGWNHHVHVCSFRTTFPLALWSILRFSVSLQNEGLLVLVVLGHVVVLLMGAVVPGGVRVVPQALVVVPLHGRGSTVASGQAQQHERK